MPIGGARRCSARAFGASMLLRSTTRAASRLPPIRARRTVGLAGSDGPPDAAGPRAGGPTVGVLTWNLFHGRAVPGAGRDLLAEFARSLAGWSWDVALLQEVPPWWTDPLARQAGAQQRTALTSRNLGLALRRAIAARSPDLLKSNGGGCNAVLVRGSPVNHVLHLILTILTCGVWAIVWIVLAVTQKEKLSMVTVDEFGNAAISSVDLSKMMDAGYFQKASGS